MPRLSQGFWGIFLMFLPDVYKYIWKLDQFCTKDYSFRDAFPYWYYHPLEREKVLHWCGLIGQWTCVMASLCIKSHVFTWVSAEKLLLFWVELSSNVSLNLGNLDRLWKLLLSHLFVVANFWTPPISHFCLTLLQLTLFWYLFVLHEIKAPVICEIKTCCVRILNFRFW